jgi:hypothetical protein
MMAAIISIAAVLVGSPIALALMVSVASRREDAQQSLSRPAGGPLEAMARRIVAYGAVRSQRASAQRGRLNRQPLAVLAADRRHTGCRH